LLRVRSIHLYRVKISALKEKNTNPIIQLPGIGEKQNLTPKPAKIMLAANTKKSIPLLIGVAIQPSFDLDPVYFVVARVHRPNLG
jgi:hypothetical protein